MYLNKNELQEILRSRLASVTILFDEPMSEHTSFKVGGPADILLIPKSIRELEKCFEVCEETGCDYFLLGGGTNLLVSDRGIRGVVILLTCLDDVWVDGTRLIASGGASVEKVCETAAEHSLSGLEFLFGMPGTIGGALWMNARCYGGEVADRFLHAQVLTPDCRRLSVGSDSAGFSYKKSPFQSLAGCIIEVVLDLQQGVESAIRKKMAENLEDRIQKGHFVSPSAGSLFKNNREFGASTGKILDELGLRGHTSGGASIASFHGNIFINNGDASASDILNLIILAVETAKRERHILLEPEVRLVGEWLPEELAPLSDVLPGGQKPATKS